MAFRRILELGARNTNEFIVHCGPMALIGWTVLQPRYTFEENPDFKNSPLGVEIDQILKSDPGKYVGKGHVYLETARRE